MVEYFCMKCQKRVDMVVKLPISELSTKNQVYCHGETETAPGETIISTMVSNVDNVPIIRPVFVQPITPLPFEDRPLATKQEVFEAVKSERDYQAALWGENPHTITEFLTYISDYAAEATHDTCRLADRVAEPKALNTIRKVAALCFACLEQHGVQKRELKDLVQAAELHRVDLTVVLKRWREMAEA